MNPRVLFIGVCLSLAACASGLPHDIAFDAQSEQAIVALPNTTGHVRLVAVDAETERATGAFNEYLSVSGQNYVLHMVPAGTYVFPSHSFMGGFDGVSLQFACVSPAPVFRVEAGKVNVATMVDAPRLKSERLPFAPVSDEAQVAEALASYSDVEAEVQTAELVSIVMPIATDGYVCMKDEFSTLRRVQSDD